MMKGHVKIELFDHSTGKRELVEHENMITNAVAYRLGIDANDSLSANGSDYSIMPLATKGLGGLFLFDGALTEDVNNVHFPMDVHLTGCAGRGTDNSASILHGTLDNTCSGYSDGKFTTVWNFLPSQANGVIASLALTHVRGAMYPFHMYRGTAWNRITSNYRHFLAMDADTDTAYFSNNYVTTGAVTIYKRKLSDHIVRIYTPYIGDESKVLDYSISSAGITDRAYWDVTPDYDGYVYLCATLGNSSGDATVYIRRLKASADGFSFEEDEAFRKTLTLADVLLYPSNASKNNNTLALCVTNGFLYCLSNDRKSVYRVSIADPSQIKQIEPDIDGFTLMEYGIYPHRGSGIWTEFTFAVKTSTGATETRRTKGLIYEDGVCLCDVSNYTTGNYNMREFCGFVADDLRMFTAYNVYHDACQNYIGTICNLENPITKTELQSLKITYSVTDA